MQTRMIETEVSIRSADDGMYIQGLGTTFDNVYWVPQDGFHETIKATAFNRSLASNKNINVCFDHDRRCILGSTETGTAKVWVDSRGLNYRVKYDPADPDHVKVKAKIDKGFCKGSSVSFNPMKVSFTRESQRHICNVFDGELNELGPVLAPCNPEAKASVRSAVQDQYQNWIETEKRLAEFKTIN